VYIPEPFAQLTVALHGAKGVAWLAELPALIAACERRWSLVVGPPFDLLSYHYVAPATRTGGEPVVLKLGVPHPELPTEIAALQHYGGHGAVRLLDADAGLGVVLLERLQPGTSLAALDDDDATRIAAGVMRRLWRPPPAEHAFPTVARWAGGLQRLRARFDGGTGPFPASLVDQAEQLFAALIVSMAAPVLLHGDLHHDNILAAGGSGREPWLAIDPKGLVGEPAYEAGALLRNPEARLRSEPAPARLLARRLEILVDELDLERERLRDWAVAQAVLAAWWHFEDTGAASEWWLALAELFATLRP